MFKCGRERKNDGMELSYLLSNLISLFLALIPVWVFFPFSSFFGTQSVQIRERSLLSQIPVNQTLPSCSTLPPSDGFVNYLVFHFCYFGGNRFLSIPFLSSFVILFFYILVQTAQNHFSVVTTKLARQLNLTPSMGGVTLLALGNGAPDVFASIAAVRSGQYRTGFGAILSAGAFVSAFVVGFVAINAAPFRVDPGSFIRDVGFYLVAAMMLFYVYLSGEISFWQAAGFVGFYAFFVIIVFWMDFWSRNNSNLTEVEDRDFERGLAEAAIDERDKEELSETLYTNISLVWSVPVSILLRLTIPQTSLTRWSKFYASANIILCPIVLLYACNSFVSLDHRISFILPNTHIPLWIVLLTASSSLALVHYIVEKEAPKIESLFVVLLAFIMSVYWISTIAGELLNCLVALGMLLGAPPSLLGLTVLAWGNSVGDLVADVAVAKAGQPAMAMAGCFAGPMFNMLVGLGTALVMQTAHTYPDAYELQFHIGVTVAFVFLLFSLMGSLLVITWSRFRVPRFWGFCLVGHYVFFMVVSLLVAVIL